VLDLSLGRRDNFGSDHQHRPCIVCAQIQGGDRCEKLHVTNDAIPRSAFNAHYFPIGKPVHLIAVDKV
jgi:hypothetical protein